MLWRSFRNPVLLEALFALAACAIAFWVGVRVDAFEAFAAFTDRHEAWQLDEILLVLAIMWIIGPAWLTRAVIRLRRAVAAQKRAEAEAARIARHDPLTGLPNRRLLAELVAERRAGPFAALLIDLDRFKVVNDLRGHQAGDTVLIATARRLCALCGGEAVPIRLGGDEFLICVLAPEPGFDAARFARRIVTSLADPVHTPDGDLVVGCSVGVAQWQPGQPVEDLLRQADQAMYQAKANGRGTWAHYDDALGDRLRDQAQLEADLRLAIRAADILPWFQPIFGIADGKILGFEALARWLHPTRGHVPPDRFIPMADEMGLLPDLSRQLLLRAARVMEPLDPALHLAFNLSPSQLADPGLAEVIREVLDESGLSAGRLEIEVTEQAVVADFDLACRSIGALQNMGVRVSLDDFGSGMSSLSVLSRLPLDAIKIDRSFVAAIQDSPEKRKIVRALLLMAASLEIGVTAEGIESAAELSVLRDMHCDRGQGYLVSRPVPAESLTALLSNAGPRTGVAA